MSLMLAPSIMCADLLHMEDEIKELEKGGADFIHYDIMDTTFTTQTMLPFCMIPRIQSITAIPLDIHLMIDRPERILDKLLPYCKDTYIGIHVEVTKEITSLFSSIHAAGGKCCAILNAGTSIHCLEEILPYIDMVNLILGNAGFCARQPLNEQLLLKIRNTRSLLDSCDRSILLEVDGGVSPEVAEKAKQAGANVFVLGTKSIYQPDCIASQECIKFRRNLEAGQSRSV
ncbi:ribulose-phosphate 3-epimerase [[Clostridium] innocuum]|nr:putative ribulose-phosphate 3-epimerase [Erysipelotrichaceae bacterium 3_1_53]MCR0346796.1 ribulose-phosphate 3-epimerase [[Clostridium] innocuum]